MMLLPGQAITPSADKRSLYEVNGNGTGERKVGRPTATAAVGGGKKKDVDSTRRKRLAPTTTARHTRRLQTPPTSCCDVIKAPFRLIGNLAMGILLILWFLLSIMFGIIMLPISPKWIIRFFRDLCRRPINEGEALAIENDLINIAVSNIKSSKLPTCPIRPFTLPHGVAQAKFTIEEGLSNDLRVGIFSRVASYDAVVRFSSEQPTDEFVNGTSGMAVKLMRVDQSLGSSYMMWDHRIMRDERDVGIIGARYETKETKDTKQSSTSSASSSASSYVDCDFIAIASDHSFFARNLREILWLGEAITSLSPFFYLPAFRCLWYKIVIQPKINHFLQSGRGPLGWSYSSMTPYRSGGHVIKYHWLPDQVHAWQMPIRQVEYPNKRAIVDYLKSASASYGLYVQFQPLPTSPDYHKFPIEDPSVPWDEKIAPLHRVATLTMPQQDIDTPQRWHLGHTISYNAWQTFYEHAPLGQINRARHRVYHMAAMERMKRLGYRGVPTCPYFQAATATPPSLGMNGATAATVSAASAVSRAVMASTQVYCEAEPYIKASPTMSTMAAVDRDAAPKTPTNNQQLPDAVMSSPTSSSSTASGSSASSPSTVARAFEPSSPTASALGMGASPISQTSSIASVISTPPSSIGTRTVAHAHGSPQHHGVPPIVGLSSLSPMLTTSSSLSSLSSGVATTAAPTAPTPKASIITNVITPSAAQPVPASVPSSSLTYQPPTPTAAATATGMYASPSTILRITTNNIGLNGVDMNRVSPRHKSVTFATAPLPSAHHAHGNAAYNNGGSHHSSSYHNLHALPLPTPAGHSPRNGGHNGMPMPPSIRRGASIPLPPLGGHTVGPIPVIGHVTGHATAHVTAMNGMTVITSTSPLPTPLGTPIRPLTPATNFALAPAAAARSPPGSTPRTAVVYLD